MSELVQVGENTFYIDNPAKIGLFRLNEKEVCLIDSGNDKDAARKAKKLLEENGWTLSAIYNTHSNADHIGGNKYLQDKTGCKIYAPGAECAIARHTFISPSFLYGGYPFDELLHKFLYAQPSDAEYLTRENVPDGFDIIDLPGHFFDMVGFRTPDDVVFLADCLSSERTLEKYQISFVYDVAKYLKTLEMVIGMRAKLFVPSHAAPTDNIAPLAQKNIDKVYEIADMLTDICKEPTNFELILKRVFEIYDHRMNFEQYALVGSTVRSYLSWLKSEGKIEAFVEDNLLLWKRK
ncbi:MAG: MBL fold metallo-hydrolase [Oscillospiraceae bacterium]|nr:MBL fold metallo-hydrolase [Oscillospiraceae bacterium]MBQ4544022.1 MBL fold metallo-hydrolase [Oscillospiraceae bacterium]MBQ6901854.1 MBL fold metallo-hydrolase [Oscillospiraceae bacterium]